MSQESEYERLLREQKAESKTIPGRKISPSKSETLTTRIRKCPECGNIFQGSHPEDECPFGAIERVMEDETANDL